MVKASSTVFPFTYWVANQTEATAELHPNLKPGVHDLPLFIHLNLEKRQELAGFWCCLHNLALREAHRALPKSFGPAFHT